VLHRGRWSSGWWYLLAVWWRRILVQTQSCQDSRQNSSDREMSWFPYERLKQDVKVFSSSVNPLGICSFSLKVSLFDIKNINLRPKSWPVAKPTHNQIRAENINLQRDQKRHGCLFPWNQSIYILFYLQALMRHIVLPQILKYHYSSTHFFISATAMLHIADMRGFFTKADINAATSMTSVVLLHD